MENRSVSTNRLAPILVSGAETLEPADIPTPGTYDSSSDVVRYYHTDAIGSVRVITDPNGTVTERMDYEPFGFEWAPPSGEQRRFTGQERDIETTLDYFGARYYTAASARFTTPDPVLPIEDALVNPQRWNRYSYVLNRPLDLTDPDGRCPSCLALLQRYGTQAAQMASRYGAAAYNWATRFFNSPTRQDLIQSIAETAAGVPGTPTLVGNLGRLSQAERATGHRLVARLGETLRVSDHIGAEFVSAAGKTFDAMGSPAAYMRWD